ncbi:DUF6541 family protein [Actinomycetaceae bacterium MB13-C1-2]|nr:DUF6541 family protein [Actinomycetaceae bacterium MB13-C1-2]
MLAWLGIVPGVLLLLGILVLPGFALLWGGLRFRAPAAFLYSPVVGAGIIGAGTILLPALGIGWRLANVVALALVVSAISVIARIWVDRSGHALVPKLAGIKWSQVAWVGAGVAVFVITYGSAIIPVMGTPDALPTVGDSVYHMQGVRIILETGYADPRGPFAELYPGTSPAPYYPTLWHALVVPVAQIYSIVEATNIGALTVGLVLWPWAIASLAAALAPSKPQVGLLAPVLAIPIVLIPGIQIFAFSIYPYSLAVVLVTQAFGLLVWFIKSPSWGIGTAVVVATLGAAAAHISTVLLVGAAVVIWGLLSAAGVVKRLFGQRRYFGGFALAIGAIALIGGGMILLPRIGYIQGINGRQTESISFRQAAEHLVLGPTFLQSPSLIPLLLALFATVAVVMSRNVTGNVVMALTVVLLLFLYMVAAGPESYLRVFTAPWWKDSSRFSTVLAAPLVSFAAVGAWAMISALVERTKDPKVGFRLVGASIAVVALVAGTTENSWSLNSVKSAFAARNYDRNGSEGVGLTEDEVALVETLDDVLEPGDLVVGDPDSGTAWVSVLSDARQFQGHRMPADSEQKFLAMHFDEIHSNPRVCEIIEDNEIRAFIQSDSPTSEFVGWNQGFNNVDTSEGFELLNQVGGARVYKITACN